VTEGVPRTSGWRSRLARIVTEATAPAVVCILLIIAVTGAAASHAHSAWAWGAATAVLVAALPLGHVLWGVRRGHWRDYHVAERAKRGKPLLFALASTLTCLAILWWGNAPLSLVALVVAMVSGLAVATLITRFWKISLHTAVATGALVVLLMTFGPRLVVLVPALVLIAWSRVQLGDHTPAQVVAGAAVGGSAAGLVFCFW
jgi:membrane-associated phospholipid phosphatase